MNRSIESINHINKYTDHHLFRWAAYAAVIFSTRSLRIPGSRVTSLLRLNSHATLSLLSVL